jgi:Zn-dependent protease
MLIQHLADDPRYFFAVVIVVVFSICLHELAHGIVAIWLGDDTPIISGHMTLNPLVHMGPVSIVALLLVGIAWGAMPVDRSRLRGKYADAMVSAAGPFANVLIATVALVGLGLWQRFDGGGGEMSAAAENGRFLLWIFGVYNVLLALFNLIPLPPLDGSRILANLSQSYENSMTMLMTYGAGALMMITLVVFTTIGGFLAPVAIRMATEFLQSVRGF